MLHNSVVIMSVYTNVCITEKTEVHNAAKYTMNIRITGDFVDYMIRPCVIKPLTTNIYYNRLVLEMVRK